MSVLAYSAAAVRAAEQPHLDAGRGEALMRRAAAGLATECIRALRETTGRVAGSRAVAFAGPGNNGGDALFAAARLAGRGVHVAVVAPLGRLHPAGLAAARRAGVHVLEAPAPADDTAPADDSSIHDTATGPTGSQTVDALDCFLAHAAQLAADADLVLDGLLGTGARPTLQPPLTTLLTAWQDAEAARRRPADRTTARRTPADSTTVRRSSARRTARPFVVAVDVPTGVDATTGRCGPVHVRADLTVTFGLHKAGLHLPGGAEAAGTVRLLDIGLDPRDADEPPRARILTAGDLADWPQPRPRDHKYTRGVLGVVAGSSRYPGAGVLTSLAAAGAGVGMLRVLGTASVQEAVLSRLPEAVTAPGRVQAWVLGPGAPDPQDMLEFLTEALGTGTPLVLDAGALALVPSLLTAAGGGPAAGVPSPLPAACVLTPHAGELTELLTRIDADAHDLTREDVEADPARWAQRAAHLTGAVVLLKGHRTVIATPDGWLWLPTPGPASLATAGSGDVLAGLVGAALATGMREGDDPTDPTDPAHRAAGLAALAVVLHNRAGEYARSASAIAEAVPAILAGPPPAAGPPGLAPPSSVPPSPAAPRPTVPGGHPHAS